MKNKIYIPYGRQSITDKDIQAVSEVLYSPFITQGPIIQKFENKKPIIFEVGLTTSVPELARETAISIISLEGVRYVRRK